MQTLRVPIYYDFASCLCYVAHRVLDRLAEDLAELDLELRWTPLDLTRLTHWERGAPLEGSGRENVCRVSSELEVPLVIPPCWLDSRPAMAVALALEGSPREAAWRERVWTAIYDEGRDPGAPDEFSRIARDLGLEADPASDRGSLEALEARTREAHASGVTGVPTLLLDGWPLSGIPADATMRSMLARFAARERQPV